MALRCEDKQARKISAFEYFVVCLCKWKEEKFGNNRSFSKLQLQKLLFLASSIGATSEEHKMLDIFDRFYALMYGPVEMDIYDMMQTNTFPHLMFDGSSCYFKNNIEELETPEDDKQIIDSAINKLREKNEEYVILSPFKLVEITHGWTAWQVSIAVAELCGNKKERMSTKQIIDSSIKTY